MKTSVAIATYNGEKYIIAQLESILNQSKKVDEVIITDDISSDDTVSVVNDFIKENNLSDSWKIVVNEENLGYAENFRKCMDMTTGDIIFLCDQDDIWELDKVEKMYSVMEDYEGIGVLVSDYVEFKNGSEIPVVHNKQSSLYEVELNCKNRFLRSLGSVMAVSQEFYQDTKKYWYKGWAQDEYLWCVAVLFNKCVGTTYCSTKRRIHENQFSGHKFDTKEKRCQYLEREIICAKHLLNIIKTMYNKKAFNIYLKNLKTTQRRLDLVKNRKIRNIFILPFYLRYYYSPKSFFPEIKIALKG